MVIVSGLAGKLARPVALTVCMSLLASLFVATTLVPMIAATIFRAKDSRKNNGGPGGSSRFREAYKLVLRGVLRQRVFVLLSAGAAFILACIGSYALVQSGEFMPEEDIPIAMMRIENPLL